MGGVDVGLCRYLSVQPTLGLELDSGRLPDNEKRQEIKFEGGGGGLEECRGGDGGGGQPPASYLIRATLITSYEWLVLLVCCSF